MNSKMMECVAQVLTITEDEINSLLPEDDLTQRGLNSISAIQLIVLLEEAYDFEIDDADLLIDSVKSLQRIEALLERYGKLSTL